MDRLSGSPVTANRTPDGPRFVAGGYLRYGDELRRYLVRRLNHEQDARDLAQEVWTRLLRVGDPSEILEPLAYIYRTASNVIAEFRMRKRREQVSFDVTAEDCAEPATQASQDDDSVQRLERQVELEQTLAKLPRTYRNILILKITEELSYKEIGERLELSPKTVEQYFFRAMAMVKRQRT